MKEWLNKYKNEIYVGLFCTIIVTFVMKMGEFLANLVPQAGETFFQAFVNFVFRNAAIQSPISFLDFIFSFITLFFFSSLCSYLLGMFRGITDAEQLKKLYAFVKNSKASGQYSDEIIEAEKVLDKIEKRCQRLKSSKLKKALIIYILSSVFIFFIFYFSCISYPIKLFHDYQLDIIQISPFIPEQELKLLNSQWVSMHGKADYDAIYEKINQIKKENNLTRGKQKRNK